MLWITRNEWLPSQSAFANQPNVWWYYGMHASIALTFILNYIRNRTFVSILVAIATAFIVIWDMYTASMLHNIATGTMAALACYDMIRYTSTIQRPYVLMNCGVGAIVFLLGFLIWDVHLFFAEMVIEFTIGVAMARRIWVENK